MNKKEISYKDLKSIFRENSRIAGFKIKHIIQIRNLLAIKESVNTISKRIEFENCKMENLIGNMLIFNEPLMLKNCSIDNCSFNGTFFLKGLQISDCIFNGYLDFQSGGHNQNGYEIKIENNIFREFVNFYDCHFSGPILINSNDFKKNTNLFGNLNEPFQVSFDIPPITKGNFGDLNKNGDQLSNCEDKS